jgi:hypothetical protein
MPDPGPSYSPMVPRGYRCPRAGRSALAAPEDRAKHAANDRLASRRVHQAAHRPDGRLHGLLDLLEESGVNSPAELAQRNAANLAVTFQEVVAARPTMVRRIPTEEAVAGWIAEAKTLDKVVSH